MTSRSPPRSRLIAWEGDCTYCRSTASSEGRGPQYFVFRVISRLLSLTQRLRAYGPDPAVFSASHGRARSSPDSCACTTLESRMLDACPVRAVRNAGAGAARVILTVRGATASTFLPVRYGAIW